MFLLVLAHLGSPRQSPESHKMVVCVYVCVYCVCFCPKLRTQCLYTVSWESGKVHGLEDHPTAAIPDGLPSVDTFSNVISPKKEVT